MPTRRIQGGSPRKITLQKDGIVSLRVDVLHENGVDGAVSNVDGLDEEGREASIDVAVPSG